MTRALVLLAALAPGAAMAQEVRPLERTPPRPPSWASEPQGLIPEPAAIERLMLMGDRRLGNGELISGFYIENGNMVPGAGWIAVGPGYRKWYGKGDVMTDASAAISWRGYKMAQARVELPTLMRSRFTVGGQFRWQDLPDVAYFGEGPNTTKADRTEFSLQSTNVVGYGIFRPVRWFGVGANAGWLKPTVNDLDEPSYLHTELSMTADTRDFAGHPTSGGLYRVAASNYADRDAGTSSFKRYDAEAAQFLPLAGGRFVIAAHGWLVRTDTDDDATVPFYLQPSLGGGNSLRGYSNYRFHDRNSLLATVEGRLALMTHVDLAVFMDAGNVAARVSDLNLDKRSYGAGLRLHSRRQTFLRLDAARSDEGWRVLLRLDDPLNLARLAKRTAAAPFVH